MSPIPEHDLPRQVQQKLDGALRPLIVYMLTTPNYTARQLNEVFANVRDPERPQLDACRVIDAVLQQLRRHDLIARRRDGKQIWWSPTCDYDIS